MVATNHANDGDHMRVWSPSIVDKCGSNGENRGMFHKSVRCNRGNLLIEKREKREKWKNGKDNLGTTRAVLVSEFIINILQIVRTTGQPFWEKCIIEIIGLEESVWILPLIGFCYTFTFSEVAMFGTACKQSLLSLKRNFLFIWGSFWHLHTLCSCK